MSISIRTYKEYQANSPPSKIIDDGAIDNSYNIPLIGKFVSGYSAEYARSILWSIEHFAGPVPPLNPTIGQLWFDTTYESLRICESTSPLSYKTISVTSPESSLSRNDILPGVHDTYNLGSEENIWGSVFADKVFVENLFFKKEDGSYANALDILSISSDEIYSDGVSLTDTLNTLYSSGGSNAIVTANISGSLTPSKGIMVIKTNTDNITVTIKSVAGLTAGDSFSISNFGSGSLTVTKDSGVAFENIAGNIIADSITLTLKTPNTWVIAGDYT